MIKDKNKVYGEVNDPDTVLSDNLLTIDKYVISKSSKKIETLTPSLKQILTYDSGGNIKLVPYGIPNMYIGTDNDGNLVPYQSSLVPSVAPEGRELEIEILGNYSGLSVFLPDTVKQAVESLRGPNWYEIEIAGAGGGGGGCAWSATTHFERWWNNLSPDPKPIADLFHNGAAGGYYKTLFIVDKDIDCIANLAVGTPGQGGAGPYYKLDKEDKLSLGNVPGGQGGKSPSVYSGTGGSPTTRTIGYLWYTTAGGHGVGINGGANGGGLEQTTTEGTGETEWKAMPSAGGGGANGPGGGTGASVTYWSEYQLGVGVTEQIKFGGSGGAGGGLGLAGDGANSINFTPPAGSESFYPTPYGGLGQGGGGGGQGQKGTGTNNFGAISGGGGGGGGATRAVLTNVKLTKNGPRQTLELIAGGGGGGAGASSTTTLTDWVINDGVIEAEAGGNNMDSIKGGGGQGGLASATYGNTTKGEVRGFSGGRGYIRIWRCV